MTPMPVIALCFGVVGSGKTTLLKKLKDIDEKEDEEEGSKEPLPTVGINHFSVQITDQQKAPKPSSCLARLKDTFHHKEAKFLPIREFGGALAPAWLNYLRSTYDDSSSDVVKGVIFVIDLSNSAKFSEIGVHIVDIVGFLEKKKAPTRVLIVFTKIDLVEESCKEKVLNEARNLLRLDYLSNWCQVCHFEQVEFSAVDNFGFWSICEWCQSLVEQ